MKKKELRMSEEFYKVIKVSDNTWSIESDMVRAWLFTGSDKALLVDTTNVHGNLAEVVKAITDLPVILVNTHADGDHIACNDQFETAWMHEKETELYLSRAGEGFAEPAVLSEGDTIDLGGRVFEVVHIPGHTHGSIALLDRENRVLVAGDTISDRPVFLFGEARDIPAFQKSLRRLKEMSKDYDQILASHGSCCVGPEQIGNEIVCLEECLAGKVAAEEPPFPIPAKMYCSHGAGFYLTL